MRQFRLLGSWWEFSEGAAVASHFRFRRSADFGFVFFSLPLFFLLGLVLCCFTPSSGFEVVSCGCYINIAGRKPISRT